MTIQQILDSFIAFNLNSLHSLLYIINVNKWTFLTIAGTLAILVMNLKEEIEDTVTEQQNVI